MSGVDVTLLLALLATGAMGGLWYGWVVSVIPGTRRVDDRTYVRSMQSINEAILNPGFLAVFVGIPVILALAVVVHFAADQQRRAWWLLAATITYVVGVLGVTAARNVPLNDGLATCDLDTAGDDEVGRARAAYEAPWNRWHNVRTVANGLAFGMVAVGCLIDAE